MEISTEMIKELRGLSGAGIMDCRSALVDTSGNKEKALDILKEKGLLKAAKTAQRATAQGVIESYIHLAGRIGSMVEINCETDFVARTNEFKELAHNIAMQVAAQCPVCLTEDQMPKDIEATPQEACLLLQPYIKDPGKTVKDVIVEVIAKTGENIRVKRFVRFELGN